MDRRSARRRRSPPSSPARRSCRRVGRIESWRTARGQDHTQGPLLCAVARKMPAHELLATIRRHWSIENDLNWQLDVLLGEDQIRGRKNNTAANHAILRRLTLNVLRRRRRS
ncbi:transposase [Mesorhizobium dulcispinae]|uniref:transposase n=1 Tax=Mesorhizobium dulcispinae TaxID=3072316 RepID=UPI003D31F64C